jgi:hypothetical protein
VFRETAAEEEASEAGRQGDILAPQQLGGHDPAMADEPENLTLKVLREMRAEMREGF